MKKNQRTLRNPVEYRGVALFSGRQTSLRFVPAAPHTGIVFSRTDLPNAPKLQVNPQTAAGKFRRTAIENDVYEVDAIEHLMSAIGGLELDNLDIYIDGPEVPGGDGSSKAYVDLLRTGKIVEQDAPKKIYDIREPIAVTEGDSSIVAMPTSGAFSVSYTMAYDGTPIGRQHLTLELSDSCYTEQVASARTFCLQSEAESMTQKGLIKGGTTENALVVGPNGVINNTLRFPDEFVRHKILDLIGDLTTLGGYLKAHVMAVKSGHSTNIKLVKKIAEIFQTAESGTSKRDTLLDVREIHKILPHRYPMLLIDKVIELDAYRRAVGIKNVTFNEPYFQGHFPDQPIMPGVLQIEAMAQLAGALLMRKGDNQKKIAILLSLDGVKLRKTVVPGDQLRIEAEAIKVKARTGEIYTRATVDGQLVAEATMKFMLADQE